MKICTFFGTARQYGDSTAVYDDVLKIMTGILKDNGDYHFYCGGKGSFDWICYRVVKYLQEDFPYAKIFYITPYLTLKYQQDHLAHYQKIFDGIIFPQALESCPIRLSYLRRNQWMVNQADIILSYVVIGGGGSEFAINYAIKKHKKIIPVLKTDDGCGSV